MRVRVRACVEEALSAFQHRQKEKKSSSTTFLFLLFSILLLFLLTSSPFLFSTLMASKHRSTDSTESTSTTASNNSRYHRTLPSLSSSVSSYSSSLNSALPLSPHHSIAPSSPHRKQFLRRENTSGVLSLDGRAIASSIPQRSASAGALMREHHQQQHVRIQRHSCHGVQKPLRPVSWVEPAADTSSRRVSFNQRVVIIANEGATDPPTTVVSSTPQNTTPASDNKREEDSSRPSSQLWWDESQLAMELAEDDLIHDKPRASKKPSARRLKQKLSAIMNTSSSASSSSSSSSLSLALHSSSTPQDLNSSSKLTAVSPSTTTAASSSRKRFLRSIRKFF